MVVGLCWGVSAPPFFKEFDDTDLSVLLRMLDTLSVGMSPGLRDIVRLFPTTTMLTVVGDTNVY